MILWTLTSFTIFADHIVGTCRTCKKSNLWLDLKRWTFLASCQNIICSIAGGTSASFFCVDFCDIINEACVICIDLFRSMLTRCATWGTCRTVCWIMYRTFATQSSNKIELLIKINLAALGCWGPSPCTPCRPWSRCPCRDHTRTRREGPPCPCCGGTRRWGVLRVGSLFEKAQPG